MKHKHIKRKAPNSYVVRSVCSTYVTAILHFLDGRVIEHKFNDDIAKSFLHKPWPYFYLILDENGRQLHKSKRFYLTDDGPIKHYLEGLDEDNF